MQLIRNVQGYKEKAVLLIKNAEGFRSIPYIDTTGNKTIGYGFNLSNPYFNDIGSTITETEADTVLTNYLNLFVYPYVSIPNSSLNDNQFAVIADMIYNLGIAGFNTFTTFIGYLNSGDINSAAGDLVGTEWFTQVGLRGIRDVMNLLVEPEYLYLI